VSQCEAPTRSLTPKHLNSSLQPMQLLARFVHSIACHSCISGFLAIGGLIDYFVRLSGRFCAFVVVLSRLFCGLVPSACAAH
jgi:hypothetical protein